jgi:uncharacterized membrane protein YdfJ with MMPL/SSD domain
MAAVAKLPDVLSASDPLADKSSNGVSPDGSIVNAPVSFSVVPASLDQSYLDSLNNAVAPARKAGLQVEYGGGAGQIAQQGHDRTSEVIGIALALILLLIMFRSLVAAGLPLIAAVFSVATGLSVIGLIASGLTFPTTAPTVATLLGSPGGGAWSAIARMPWLIGAVVLLSLLLLTTAFRPLAIGIKAAIMNLLSVGAAYGVIVAIFQWGWGSSLVGIEQTVPIPSFVPMLMFAIVFGLSMDYEVFLISRVHEAWLATRDSHRAVAIGIGATARVITTAAAIMVVVFSSFILSDDPTVKMLAVGMAVAVLIDATVVRMILVPAVMTLLGKHAWWLPEWLDRLVPNIDLEGSAIPSAPPVGP